MKTIRTGNDWERVAAAYRAAGLTPLLDAETGPTGLVYDKKIAALASDRDAALALHDLAHYLVTPIDRRERPNFGLGPHPNVMEPNEEVYEPETDEATVDYEETVSSYLNVELARAMFGEAAAGRVAGYLNAAGKPNTRIVRAVNHALRTLSDGLLAAFGAKEIRARWPGKPNSR